MTAARVLLLFIAVAAGCTTQTTVVESSQVTTATPAPDADRRARVRLELAAAYFGRGQAETALDEVRQALDADPKMVAAYNLRGLIYAELRDDRQAEESFRRALSLDPRDADTMHNFGWFLCQRGRFGDADAQFTAAIALPTYRDIPRTMMVRGICQARAGQLDQAEKTLSRSFELDPSNATTAANLADVLYREGQYERARFYVRRANSNPDLASAQTLWLAARIEHRMGNAAGARDFGAQLRDRFPASPQALLAERGRYDD